MLDDAARFTEGGLRLQPIRLGRLTLRHPVILAPMSGVTDRPFRRIVRKFGAELVVTEMLASKAVIREQQKTLKMSERYRSKDFCRRSWWAVTLTSWPKLPVCSTRIGARTSLI